MRAGHSSVLVQWESHLIFNTAHLLRSPEMSCEHCKSRKSKMFFSGIIPIIFVGLCRGSVCEGSGGILGYASAWHSLYLYACRSWQLAW